MIPVFGSDDLNENRKRAERVGGGRSFVRGDKRACVCRGVDSVPWVPGDWRLGGAAVVGRRVEWVAPRSSIDRTIVEWCIGVSSLFLRHTVRVSTSVLKYSLFAGHHLQPEGKKSRSVRGAVLTRGHEDIETLVQA